MSGVYIKGMEMPTSCYKCPLRRRDGMDIVCPVAHERFSVADVNILEYRLDNCPLVPVQPHGDLIDRDKLEKDIDKYIGGEESRSRFNHWVQVQRTVIPESEEEHT